MQLQFSGQTGGDGWTSLTITGGDPGRPRQYLDGQIYEIDLAVVNAANAGTEFNSNLFISVLLFSETAVPDTVTWNGDVLPILQQYANLYPRPHGPVVNYDPGYPGEPNPIPLLHPVISLTNKDWVGSFAPRILTALGLPIEHPNHMPVTRDLSAGRRGILQKWMQQVIAGSIPLEPGPVIPPDAVTMARRAAPPAAAARASLTFPTARPQRCGESNRARHSSATRSRRTVMLKIKPIKITDLASLQFALQKAIELEHATIPPYLTAYYTLRGTSPGGVAARQILHSIVIEEMLHMHLACNILNAIGGAPAINAPNFIPTYPGPLPMGIGGADGLVVGIKRYSKATVQNTFMEIEEPENPIHIPVKTTAFDAIEPSYETIGQFYAAIGDEITKQGNSIFTGDPGRQVPGATIVKDCRQRAASDRHHRHPGRRHPNLARRQLDRIRALLPVRGTVHGHADRRRFVVAVGLFVRPQAADRGRRRQPTSRRWPTIPGPST